MNKDFDVSRPIESAKTTLHDPSGWKRPACQVGVQLYCTAGPYTREDEARWTLLIGAYVRTKRGRAGKRFAIGSAEMSRDDLQWLRDQINGALRRKP